MISIPSIHTSVARLEAIRVDNYIGAGGKEYSQGETDELIWEKYQRKADAVDFVVAESYKPVRVVVMPPYPSRPSIFDAFDREKARQYG